MAEIPYFFETPVPKYFREAGWFDNENTFKYVTWAFSRCSTQPNKIVKEGREFTLAPYEFISGRLTSPKECFLTENQFRNQQISMVKAGLLKKTTNSLTNHFSCYIWVTERFCKDNNQQNNQPTTNRPPTDHHNPELKNIRTKEDHHPNPSSDLMTDDLSSKSKIEIVPGVFLSQEELDACIAVKGSRESVQYAIGYIVKSPGRKCKIYDWPNTLARWQIKNDIKPKLIENQEMGRRLEKEYSDLNLPWRCRVFHDRKVDQKGVLFEPSSPYLEPFFLAFIDGEFREKAAKFLRDKKMQRSRIS